MDVDSVQYSWVVFGDACRRRFYIFSIRPVLAPNVLTAIFARLQSENFPVNQAIIRNNASCPIRLPYLAAFGASSIATNNDTAFDLLATNKVAQQTADQTAEEAIQNQRISDFNAYLAGEATRRQNNQPPTVFTGIRPPVYDDATNSTVDSITVNRSDATFASIQANRSVVNVTVNTSLINGTISGATSFPNNTSGVPTTTLTVDVVPSNTNTPNLTGTFTNLTFARNIISYQISNFTNGTNRLCTFYPVTGVNPVGNESTYCTTLYDNMTIQITDKAIAGVRSGYDSFFQNNQTTLSIFNLTTFVNMTIENITNGTLSDINTTNFTTSGGSAASSAIFRVFKTNGTNFTERINLDSFIGFNRTFYYPNRSNFTILQPLGNLPTNTSIITLFNHNNGTNITNISLADPLSSNNIVNNYILYFRSVNMSASFNFTLIQYNQAPVAATPAPTPAIPSNYTLENKTIFNNGTTIVTLFTPFNETSNIARVSSFLRVLTIPRLAQVNPDTYSLFSDCIQANLSVSQLSNARVEILNNTRSPGANYERRIQFTSVDSQGKVLEGSASVKLRYFNGTSAEWNSTITGGVNTTTGFFLKPNTTVVGGTPIRENFGPGPTDPTSDAPADSSVEPQAYTQICPPLV